MLGLCRHIFHMELMGTIIRDERSPRLQAGDVLCVKERGMCSLKFVLIPTWSTLEKTEHKTTGCWWQIHICISERRLTYLMPTHWCPQRGLTKPKYTKSGLRNDTQEQQVPISQLHSSAVGAYARVIAQFKQLAKDKQPAGPARNTKGHVFPTSHSCASRIPMTLVQRGTVNPIPFPLLNCIVMRYPGEIERWCPNEPIFSD